MKLNVKNLNLAMAESCLTASELTEKADLGSDTLYRLKCGREARPQTIGRLARVLNVPVTELIEQEG